MSFDPVSYAMGKQAGGGGGPAPEPVLETLNVTENGEYYPDEGVDGFDEVIVDVEGSGEPVLETLTVTENGTYTPDPGVDGFDSVEVDVPIAFEPLNDQATAYDILSGAEAYDYAGNVIQGSLVLPPALQNQAAAGDIRYGKSCYDTSGNLIDGSLQSIHIPGPIYWDATNAKFNAPGSYMAAAMMATLAADGAITGYLVNSETAIPIPCVVHLDSSNNLVLTGGICVVSGNDTDKYIVYCNIGTDGTISNEKCSLIRVVTTVSRHLSDWMADGDYLSLFVLA